MSAIRASASRIPGRRFLAGLMFGLSIPLCAQAAAPVQIGIGDAMVQEGNSGTTDLLFNVQRVGGSDLTSNVVIPYRVSPSGTHPATPGVDYVAPPANATLRIPAGQSAQTLHVPVIGDTAVEQNETLQVQLGKALAFAPDVNFQPTPNYPAGNFAISVASGDFNGDGYPDLVVMNASSHSPMPGVNNSVSILLGKAAGGYAAPVEYPLLGRVIPLGAGTVVVADFNGDGHPDVAVALANAQDISGAGYQIAILLGDGTGGFAAPAYSAYSAATRSVFAFAMVAADFNGDGKLDLAVSNGGIVVFLGDGRGGFTAKGSYPAESMSASLTSSAYAIAVGDFNRDGHLDVAATNINSVNVSILLGDGTGALATAVNYPGGTGLMPLGGNALTAGDFDGDGKLDLALAAPATNNVSILRGNGAGGFTTPTVSYPVGTNPSAVIAVDFDGDGKLDLAVPNYSSNDLSILRGDGAGGFAAAVSYVTNGPLCVTAADLNHDGHPDLAVGSLLGVSVLFGDGSGGLAAPVSYAVGNYPLAVAVLADVDGRPGLVTVNSKGSSLSLLPNLGGGRLGPAVTLNLPGNPTAVAVADFDGDGQPDLAVTERAGGGIEYENLLVVLSGSGATVAYALDSKVTGAPTSVAAGDLNGDGHPDLVVTNVDPSNTVSILLNDGVGGFKLKANAPVMGLTPTSVILRDFNGDGLLDITTANRGSNNVSIQFGLGGGNFAAAATYPVGPAPTSVAAGDFDGDGALDLAVANSDPSSNTVSILRNNGDGTFTAAGILITGNQPAAVAAADFNGDGHIDLAVTNAAFTGSSVSILLGDGAGGFAAPVNYGTAFASVPGAIVAVDIDGDGDPDLAVTNLASNNVTVLRNQAAQPVTLLNGGIATGTILDDDGDYTPNAFSFAAVGNATPNTVYTSNAITVSGLGSGVTAAISVTGGSYSIGCTTSFVTNAGLIGNGQTVCVRQTSSPAFAIGTTATLTIGGVSAGYVVTTLASDTVPNVFVLGSVTGVNPGSSQTSSIVTVSGINSPSPISISGANGQYKINSGAYTSASGTVNNGDTVTVQAVASSGYATTIAATLNIGGVSADFSIATRAANTTPTAFSFSPVTGATPAATVQSNSILVSGIEAAVPISISGDASAKFCINGGACLATVGAVVNNGDAVKVQLTASNALNTGVQGLLDIGGTTASFLVTTAGSLPVLTPSFGITTSGAVTSNTPVIGGPAGSYSFNARFCATASNSLSQLYSQTVQLTNNNSLLNRTGDGPDPAQPGAAGSTLSFVRAGAYADGSLSPGECITVPYVIGLTNKNKFTFTIDLHGVKN